LVKTLNKILRREIMQSIRKVISTRGDPHRIFTEIIDWTGVTPGNNAVAAITEVDGSHNPFQGDATMKIYNVVPLHNRFSVRGEVDWHAPLLIRITVIFE
jgi:hypothetical protein